MQDQIQLRYDRIGDILYIETCTPHVDQKSEEIGDEVIARTNPESGAVESLEILFFSKRLLSGEILNLPLHGDFQLVS